MVLVSADHIRPWTVTIVDGDQPKAMVLPRRWLDIHGMRINDVWEAALRAVVGIILLRPGVSQVSSFLVLAISQGPDRPFVVRDSLATSIGVR